MSPNPNPFGRASPNSPAVHFPFFPILEETAENLDEDEEEDNDGGPPGQRERREGKSGKWPYFSPREIVITPMRAGAQTLRNRFKGCFCAEKTLEAGIPR